MIIQCDHCSARFRMDDSKLARGPVKVRCAKCKEVFVVKPEEPAVEAALSAAPEPAPPPAEGGGPSEFSFDLHAGSSDSFSQGPVDFSFDAETPSVGTGPASEQAEPSTEFDWQGGAAPSFDASGAGSDFDLSSFDASLAAPKPEAAAPQADDSDFDFGDVDLSASAAPSFESKGDAAKVEADDFSMDFGDVSFSDHPAESTGSAFAFSEPSAEKSAAVPDFSAQSPEPSASDDFLLSFNADAEQKVSQPAIERSEPEKESVDFGEFSFGEMGDAAAAAGVAAAKLQEPVSEGFAAAGVAPQFQEEELPPSSLTTRKKSGSLFPLFVIIGAIILIIVLAGSGVYFFGGPKAFSKVGLGFLVEWYGDKGGEEGSIALKGVTASYTVNSTAGELFVVRGEAVNNFKKPRASIQIKVSLLGPGGAALVTKSAFCGNSLSNEQLAKLPLAKIEETMNNQFGDSLANLGLKPGDTIPFAVVVSPVPKEATDYTVVVGGSTVATQ